MSTDYGHTNIDDLEDLLPKYGMAEHGEARYVREDVGAQGIGISHYRMNPGKRTGFGHRHKEAEEMYVVLNGSGRVKVDDEIVDLRARDVVRVAPAAVREFEAGPQEVGKGGVVRDPAVHARVCDEVRAWLEHEGWTVAGLTESPITGPMGNVEFLIAAMRRQAAPD